MAQHSFNFDFAVNYDFTHNKLFSEAFCLNTTMHFYLAFNGKILTFISCSIAVYQ